MKIRPKIKLPSKKQTWQRKFKNLKLKFPLAFKQSLRGLSNWRTLRETKNAGEEYENEDNNEETQLNSDSNPKLKIKCEKKRFTRRSYNFNANFLCKRRFWWSVFLTVNFLFVLWITFMYLFGPRHVNENYLSLSRIKEHPCDIPVLNPYDEEVIYNMKHPAKINCLMVSNGRDSIVLSDYHGNLVLNSTNELESCCYNVIYRVNEHENRQSKCIKVPVEKLKKFIVPESHEFIDLKCKSKEFYRDYREIFAFVHRKNKTEERVAEKEKKLSEKRKNERLSVIIFGMDTTSHMNFIRQMPKSRKYMMENLEAFPLNGYVKVGENSLPNVTPFLSGTSIRDFERKCRVHEEVEGHPQLDRCKALIWNKFAEAGYRTSFAEDDVGISIFNFAWKWAFDREPTDYYLRTFSNHAQKTYADKDGYCYGSKLSFHALLENIKTTAEAFPGPNEHYFQFTWSTKLSHDYPTYLSNGDKHLLNTLKFLDERGHLNKTAFILLSDHGSRDEKMRFYQGEMENRMPVAYLILPKWWSKIYPLAAQNLRANADRLTTGYDLHETLRDFMNFGRIPKRNKFSYGNRKGGISLFREINVNRTCHSARIPMHWCVCYKHEIISEDYPIVQDAVAFSLRTLNKLLFDKIKKFVCSDLRLSKILDAVQWEVPAHLFDKRVFAIPIEKNNTKIKGKPSSSNNIVEESGTTFPYNSPILIIQMTFETSPGNGHFEATLIKNPNDAKKWVLSEKIVRVNKYAKQSECINDYELKEYCFCLYRNRYSF